MATKNTKNAKMDGVAVFKGYVPEDGSPAKGGVKMIEGKMIIGNAPVGRGIGCWQVQTMGRAIGLSAVRFAGSAVLGWRLLVRLAVAQGILSRDVAEDGEKLPGALERTVQRVRAFSGLDKEQA